MLSIEKVSAGYGQIQVLWDVSMEVRDQEIVALVGSNGAGKTTLLSVISGIVPARSGKIMFDGRDITHAPSDEIVNLGIIHVPQGRRLFPGLTVKENLMQGAFSRRDRAEVNRSYDMVMHLFPALEKKLKDPAGKLSGGQQQMVAIGRGLMAKPKLLMIDELSLGLAPLIVDNIIEAAEQINREQGTSLLIVEQDVEVSLSHAHRGYVLETGHMTRSDAADKLLHDDYIRSAYLGL
ncbi:MAG TPA: ABC transporter ATP-binding protein [Thermoflexales bacterium]|nr:ABC transporter ATP-binding protein [Thermoflexales bacterium]HQW37014.1 ABC transporter ATP-binding protein [Thermoflexales bacterium]HQX76412.1 ABC transporter ATP-binding protein [Thermoflexales bacterium]HQZ22204.1 ABC transporter ATP-binding protein [Thermoflexales bacterium]HQZ98625.1 ABC transporter ATP-binding protein [Thermoflexales bacterium]